MDATVIVNNLENIIQEISENGHRRSRGDIQRGTKSYRKRISRLN